MKRLIPMALVLVMATSLTAGCSSVSAQDKPTTVSSSSNVKGFDEHKARILNRISERLTRIQEIQSCVQGANDPKSLQACRPHHKDKRHHGHDHHAS